MLRLRKIFCIKVHICKLIKGTHAYTQIVPLTFFFFFSNISLIGWCAAVTHKFCSIRACIKYWIIVTLISKNKVIGKRTLATRPRFMNINFIKRTQGYYKCSVSILFFKTFKSVSMLVNLPVDYWSWLLQIISLIMQKKTYLKKKHYCIV